MGDGAEAMEQHSHKLNDQDEGKEEHKHQTNGLQLQVLLADEDLGGTVQVSQVFVPGYKQFLPPDITFTLYNNSLLIFLVKTLYFKVWVV